MQGMAIMHDYDKTRESWNRATLNHNRHKGDQAEFFRNGGNTLFPEELEFLGDIKGQTLVHLQCNCGQDTLSLAARGANVVGVDFSEEAIGFAKKLSTDSGIKGEFELSEVVNWMQNTDQRFDIAFASYGATCWLPDLDAWAEGVQRVLKPGGRLVYVEFHPMLWCFAEDFSATEDDYFHPGPYIEPVNDYVATSGGGLLGSEECKPGENNIPATSWQHGLAKMIDTLARHGFRIEAAKEYPYSNGCCILEGLVEKEGRRYTWPEGIASMPLMYGISASR